MTSTPSKELIDRTRARFQRVDAEQAKRRAREEEVQEETVEVERARGRRAATYFVDDEEDDAAVVRACRMAHEWRKTDTPFRTDMLRVADALALKGEPDEFIEGYLNALADIFDAIEG